jgi:hypothetical protein
MTLIELRAHIKTRLGSPVINVELADEQMDLYIDDAVDKFIEVHYDGLDLGYIFIETIVDQPEYILDNRIHSVLEVTGTNNNLINDEPLLINPYTVGDVQTFSTSALDIVMFRQSMALYTDFMSDAQRFEFNSTTHLLTLLETPTSIQKYGLKVHRSPENIEDIYNNSWVRKFSSALCKIAWAGNLKKFEGSTLPGGVSLNWSAILEEGNQEKEVLEEELYNRYQEPIDFFHV